MAEPVELLELPRPGGRTILRRIGDGPACSIELRAILDDGRSKGVQIYGAELTRVIEVLTAERNREIGHPRHTEAKRR